MFSSNFFCDDDYNDLFAYISTVLSNKYFTILWCLIISEWFSKRPILPIGWEPTSHCRGVRSQAKKWESWQWYETASDCEASLLEIWETPLFALLRCPLWTQSDSTCFCPHLLVKYICLTLFLFDRTVCTPPPKKKKQTKWNETKQQKRNC